ncbi:DUF2848 family protein [Saccharothrix australiensis]|uniref:DUF2848 family protein n=1 Tax=Saccharothrix australiensis TaxID=2072 RepID=UPI001FE91247|nr:DUF2848 family protein [Saccharothrix australiensis]
MRLHVAGTGEVLTVDPRRLVVAGYTGRDEHAVAEHIAELAAIGVPEPATVPAFYDLDPGLLTTDPVVEVGGPATSGEVEPVVVRHDGRYFLGVGSDHTDRDLERTDIAAAKAGCPKPIGGSVAEVDLSTVDWDRIVVDSSVDGWPYQRGPLSALRRPDELLARLTAVLGETTGDLVVFCGTLPLLSGQFVYGAYWRTHVELPGGPTLTHAYETKQRSE